MFIAFGLMVPYLYITDRALASGADPKLAYWLLSSIGAANTVGRIVSGILPSVTSIKVIEYSYVCISIAGIMTIISGFYMRMEFQFIYACMYGMAGCKFNTPLYNVHYSLAHVLFLCLIMCFFQKLG